MSEILYMKTATDTLHEDRPQILYMKTGHRILYMKTATDTLHEDRPQILYMKTGHRYFT